MANDSSERFVLLNELAEEFADRYRRGERPAIQEYVDRHPELADDIREFFPAMANLEQVKEDQHDLKEPDAESPLPPLERLGDYRIVRQIGQGGMGVVYEAEQVSLGRHVALKVLPKSLLIDARSKRRFEREAKAAAKLHHTNIVPVFGVGEHDGLPYYVMQFIQGLGLDEVLTELKKLGPGSATGVDFKLATAARSHSRRPDVSAADMVRSLATGGFATPEAPAGADDLTQTQARNRVSTTSAAVPDTSIEHRPDGSSFTSSSFVLPGAGPVHSTKARRATYWQSVARIGTQVADALEYAHRQGILHRDVKPSNLLLDTQATVWVTDFGLAKADDQQNLTHTGDVLGTLRYMPPEAFEGKTDARSDVYSLGLTLYELLALRPAFDEKDRPKLIKQVTTEEPARLGRLNSRVPRDLVTIVHKAIERDAGHRYASAGDLCADLQRFLDDEPIKARRTSVRERASRWCRRNPFIAGSAAAVVLVFVAAFAAVSVALWDARRARTLAELRRIDAERNETEAMLQKALAESRRGDAERNEREAMLQKKQADRSFAEARKAVDDYLNQVTDGAALKAPGLQPLRRDLLASALKFYDGFLKERGADPALQSELAAIHLRVAKIQTEMGNATEASKAAREAVRLFEALASASPGDPAFQNGLIESYDRAGEAAKAIAVGEKFLRREPTNLLAKAHLAGAFNSLASIRGEEADHVGAMQAYERSLRVREELFQADPANADYEFGLAVALNNIGTRLEFLNRASDALVLYRRSKEHARRLYEKSPRDFQKARLLIRGFNNSARQEEKLGLHDQSLATNLEGLEWTRRLVASDPNVPEYVYFCHEFATERATLLDALSRRDEALPAFRVAVEMSQSPLIGKFSGNDTTQWIRYAIIAARAAELIGERSKELTPAEKADHEQMARSAVAHIRHALEAGYTNPQFLANGKQLNVLRSRADFRELLAQAEKGEKPKPGTDIAKTPPSGAPVGSNEKPATAGKAETNRDGRGDLAASRYALGMVQLKFGLREQAGTSLEEARVVFDALLRDDPKSPRNRLDLARTHLAVGELQYDSRRLPQALASWIAGRDLLRSVVKEVPRDDPVAVEAASMLVALGNSFVTNFPRSEADVALAACMDTSFAAVQDSYLYHGLNRLAAKDLEGYRLACERMLKEAATKPDENGWFAGDTAVLCAVSKESKIAPSRFVPLAERAAQLVYPDIKQFRTIYLALSYYRAARFDDALKQLQISDHAAQLNGKPWNQEAVLAEGVRALALQKTGRFDDARQALSKAKRWHAEVEWSILIRSFGENGLPNQLYLDIVRQLLREACFEVAGESFRDDLWRACPRIWGEIQYGRTDRARAAMTALDTIDPKDADLLAARAFFRAEIGDKDRARADRESALRIVPDHLLARFDRGRQSIKIEPDKAADDLVVVLSKLPDTRNTDDDRWLVDHLLVTSDRAFECAVRLRPNDPQLWIARGRHFAWNERWKEAADAYAKGIGSRPIWVDWLEYAEALVLSGDIDGYRKLCTQLDTRLKSPDVANVPWATGPPHIATRMTNLHPDSRIDAKVYHSWINSVLRTPSAWAVNYYASGAAFNRDGKPDEALAQIRRGLTLEPLWVTRELNYYQLAIAHARLGNFDEARRWFGLAESLRAGKFDASHRPPRLPLDWNVNDLMETEIFRREARSLIGSEAASTREP